MKMLSISIKQHHPSKIYYQLVPGSVLLLLRKGGVWYHTALFTSSQR
jgi:hypothetical protein